MLYKKAKTTNINMVLCCILIMCWMFCVVSELNVSFNIELALFCHHV